MDPSVWSRLPEDIQLNIANKLPSLGVVRSVCKSWYEAIPYDSKLPAYACREYLLRNEQSKVADFSYLPGDLLDYKNIVSCSRDGLMLLDQPLRVPDYNSPLVVTNPFTKSWHSFPRLPLPSGHKHATRLHAEVHDTPHSFTVIYTQYTQTFDEPVKSFWIGVYRPETGCWGHPNLIDLGDAEQLVLFQRGSTRRPLAFNGAAQALYFLSVSSSSRLQGSGEHTLNCVRVGDGRLEKLHSWSSLPRGMWPAEKRVHPKLVVCSGQLMLVGASFEESGEQGPVVLLSFEWEKRGWRVLDEVVLPGYVAGKLNFEMNCMFFRCILGVEECFCDEDLLVTGCEWDDDIMLLSFCDENETHAASDHIYDLRSRSLERFVFPVVDMGGEHSYRINGVRHVYMPTLPRRSMVRMHFSSRGRIAGSSIPENKPIKRHLS